MCSLLGFLGIFLLKIWSQGRDQLQEPCWMRPTTRAHLKPQWSANEMKFFLKSSRESPQLIR